MGIVGQVTQTRLPCPCAGPATAGYQCAAPLHIASATGGIGGQVFTDSTASGPTWRPIGYPSCNTALLVLDRINPAEDGIFDCPLSSDCCPLVLPPLCPLPLPFHPVYPVDPVKKEQLPFPPSPHPRVPHSVLPLPTIPCDSVTETRAFTLCLTLGWLSLNVTFSLL